jgi:hypothetical protein
VLGVAHVGEKEKEKEADWKSDQSDHRDPERSNPLQVKFSVP